MVGHSQGSESYHGFGKVRQAPHLTGGMGGGFPLSFFLFHVKQGGEKMDVETAVNVYVNMLNYCLPVALVFGLGNMCVKTLLRVAFGGKLSFDA